MGYTKVYEDLGTIAVAYHRSETSPNGLPDKTARCRRVAWKDIADRFSNPRECLASYLALESAEVVAGIKPANLISIPNRTYPCGRNPYQLWKRFGKAVIETTPLEAKELTDRGESVLLLLYRPAALNELLGKAAVRVILTRTGYTVDTDLAQVLDGLAARLAGGVFPHEIGIFLGYPLKDVVGFMGLAKIPFSCQGPWKIYGNPTDSLRLAENFRCCRRQMAAALQQCASPAACLADKTEPHAPFFSA